MFPYKSSLTGADVPAVRRRLDDDTGKQWTQPLMHYILFEVVADTLKRTTDIDYKKAIVTALKATNLDTLAGNINFSSGGASNPVPNVATTPLAGGQWIKGAKYPFDLMIVSNEVAPDASIQQDVTPLVWR